MLLGPSVWPFRSSVTVLPEGTANRPSPSCAATSCVNVTTPPSLKADTSCDHSEGAVDLNAAFTVTFAAGMSKVAV